MSPFHAQVSKIGARLSKLAFLPVVIYCAALARHALRANFSLDDPMNIGYAWRSGFWYLLWHSICFWTTAYRPVGELVYLSIYRIFGLNPLPYRIVILGLIVANAYLSFRLAERITGSPLVGFLTGLFAGAHGGMVDLYYENHIIYDVLAYFFAMLTLIRYVDLRKKGVVPTRGQTIVIVCLFLAALNSKEIAVTLVGFILAYEVLFHGGPSWGNAMAWVKREGRLPMILALLAVVYTAGKLLGSDSLAHDEGYKLHVSVAKYLDSRLHHWNDLFYMFPSAGQNIIIAIDVALLAVLLLFKRSPALRWCSFYVLTAALPVTFIPLRSGVEIYLALFGWALLVSIVLVKLIEVLSPTIAWTRFRIPSAVMRLTLVMGVTYGYVSATLIPWRNQTGLHLRDQAETWSILSQIKNLSFRPEHDSRVIFLEDPLVDYRLEQIAELVWDDPSVQVDLADKHPTPPTPGELEKFDSLLTIEGGQVKVVRRSH